MKRVTLKDVAVRAGVSRSAASLVVRNTGRLGEETRQRVRDAMDELGYVYHRGAAMLRTQQSSLVGLIVTDISNPFFATMSLGFEQALSAVGCMTMLSNSFDDPLRFEALVRSMLEHPVDALVYVPVAGASLDFAASGAPVPALAATREPDSDVSFVGPDDRSGGRLATEHLAGAHGRRHFVYLGGPKTAGPRSHRLEGMQQAIDEIESAQLVLQLPGPTTMTSAIHLADQLLDAHVDFDAVVCHSDVIAFALCHALRDIGVAVPSDVAVVGFDGLDESAVFEPTISSVSAGPADLGRLLAQWVTTAREGGEPEHRRVLEPSLIRRGSCGC